MLEFLFNYVLPVISFGMAIFFFIRFWKFRDVLDDETIRLIRQAKTMFGTDLGARGNKSQADTKNYNSAKGKVGSKIKGLMPFGLLDELNDQEVHSYIMHEDTIKVALKLKELFGGEWKLPGMPKLPGKGGGGDRREEMKPI